MNDNDRFESFPIGAVLLANLVSFSIYAAGIYILWQLAPIVSVLYIAYCAAIEVRLLKHSCVDCYYYGKICCFGKGLLCSHLFKKGDSKKFNKKEVSWYDIIPDFMVTIIPVIGGMISLVGEFSLVIVALIVIMLGLGFAGSAIIRGSFACRYCRQRDLGCPAQAFFEKKLAESE
ncbi:MAG: hypothetical protein JSV94_03410 [Methanobacteriota archaeon]|nr:MAG: hypothetical protein JSV94_03410 [Euryarchaeota archaeon]